MMATSNLIVTVKVRWWFDWIIFPALKWSLHLIRVFVPDYEYSSAVLNRVARMSLTVKPGGER